MAAAVETKAGGAREGLWIASGLRTPFAKVDGPLSGYDAIALSVPSAQAMVQALDGGRPDLAIWGAVVPSLGWSNIAREVMLDAKLDPTIPAFSTVMACATSMMAAIEAAGMLDGRGRHLALAGGVESMSRVQIGLTQTLSDWVRHFFDARTVGQRLELLKDIQLREVKLYIPSITNRATGKSMGEHAEEMAKRWDIARADQDELALESHQRAVAAWKAGFFADLVFPFGGLDHDTIPRADTSFEKLAKLKPVFDRTSGQGTLTAGNSSPLTDGSAAIWVGDGEGMARVPERFYRARLIDWEIGAIDLWQEGLLMALGLLHPAPAGAARPALRRHSTLGTPRGVLGPGGVPHQGAAGPRLPARQGGRRPRLRTVPAGPDEPQRRQRRARSPVRRHRRAHSQPGGERADEARQGRARDRLDLHRWRPGRGDAVGARLDCMPADNGSGRGVLAGDGRVSRPAHRGGPSQVSLIRRRGPPGAD